MSLTLEMDVAFIIMPVPIVWEEASSCQEGVQGHMETEESSALLHMIRKVASTSGGHVGTIGH